MSERGLNSADTSQPGARHAVALGLVLLSVTVVGAALGGVMAAESQSSPVEISNWTDLQAINDGQATLSDDYVLVNDLNKSTAGYNAVVLNQTTTEFTERVFFDEGESRVNLTRTPVAEILSNDAGLNLTVVDSANGTIERENTSSFSGGDVTYNTSTERFVGFSPIGASLFELFSGSFDGRENTIRDLLIDRPTEDYVGLFGFSEGTIEQVTLANATITGSGSDVGGLVGYNFEGAVSNSSASGAVDGSGSVGGLVGTNNGMVSHSSASVDVTATGNLSDVGGLVGYNFEGAVNNSSASGDVTATGELVSAGGLVGYNSGGIVSNSSTSGAVNGSFEVGGLVGDNFEGTVSTSSASGDVNGSDSVGGLVGDNYNGTVSNSSASGDVTATGELVSAGGLVGNNFEGAVSNSSASGAVDGSGSVGGLVGTNNGMVSHSSASVDVTATGNLSDVGGLVGYNFEGAVNNSSASGDVTATGELVSAGGLVGYNSGGIVSTSSASGAVNGSFEVGGLVGNNFEGTVSTSSASGVVNGSDSVGGLVGDNYNGTVSNSSASGAVNGSDSVGGLVGDNSNGPVSNSSATGDVTATGDFSDVGGLVGFNFDGTVSESFATGAVTGSSEVGGLVGANAGTVTGAYWDIQATGQSQSAGGLGLNTSQMQGASAAQNMGALDFTSTWQVVTNPPEYPELRSLSDAPDPEPPLTAGFTITPENPTVGEQLTLDADPSTPESDIEGYNWTLGDGTTATGKQVTHTYTDSGQFTVELTVQNSAETDTATETVSVSPPSSFEVSDLTAPAQATPGTTIDVNATITNTGGAAGTQAVAFVFDGTTVANTTVELNASESTSVAFSPTVPDSPGTYEHGVFTDDDNKTAQITVGEPGLPNVMLSSLSIAGQGDNATVTAGSYDVSVELSHDGGPNRTVPMELTIGNATTTETVSLNASESKTVTFENATGELSPAVYNVTVSAVDASLTGELTLSVPVGDEPDPASDTDDDGLLEDTDGSGEFTIFDVQTFFVEFQSDPVQTNSALFNFDESGDGEVTIFDVQALFLELAG